MTGAVRAVPELAPVLGRMSSPVPRGPAELPLDDLRFELLSALYAAAAAARAELGAGHPDRVRRHLSRDAWLAAWSEAAGGVSARLLAALDARFAAAAAESRMPRRRLARRGLPDGDREVIRTRVLACGIPLEEVPRPEEADDWEAGLLRAAIALDDAWERLEGVVVEELARYQPAVDAVRAWRRPLAPLWAVTVVTMLVVTLLGLSLGGYLPAPGLVGTLQRLFWSLPWP